MDRRAPVLVHWNGQIQAFIDDDPPCIASPGGARLPRLPLDSRRPIHPNGAGGSASPQDTGGVFPQMCPQHLDVRRSAAEAEPSGGHSRRRGIGFPGPQTSSYPERFDFPLTVCVTGYNHIRSRSARMKLRTAHNGPVSQHELEHLISLAIRRITHHQILSSSPFSRQSPEALGNADQKPCDTSLRPQSYPQELWIIPHPACHRPPMPGAKVPSRPRQP